MCIGSPEPAAGSPKNNSYSPIWKLTPADYPRSPIPTRSSSTPLARWPLSRVRARREPSFGVDCRRAWTDIRYERSVFDDCPQRHTRATRRHAAERALWVTPTVWQSSNGCDQLCALGHDLAKTRPFRTALIERACNCAPAGERPDLATHDQARPHGSGRPRVRSASEVGALRKSRSRRVP